MRAQLISIAFLIWSLLVFVFSWSCWQYADFAKVQDPAGAQMLELISVVVYIVFLFPIVYWRLVELRKPKWLGILGFFPPAMLGLCIYLSFAKETSIESDK